MRKIEDRTIRIEKDVKRENNPSLKYIVKLWCYTFLSAKAICIIFMALTIFLALLRPILAFIWRNYVDRANEFINGENIIPILSLALAYYLISLIADLIMRYTERYEDIERLDLVQKNRFQEMLQARMFRKLSTISVEHSDVPPINDTISRVFSFTSNAWEGISQSIMKPGYLIIAKLVSVISIAASLYIISPWLCLILIVTPVPTLYTTYIGDKLKFRFIKENAEIKREIDYFQALMLGKAVKELKVLSLFDFFYDKWKILIDEYTIKENKIYFKNALFAAFNNIISSIASVSANIMAIVLFTMGRISLGSLSAAMSLVPTLLSDTSILFSSVAAILSKKNEAAMFFDLMELPSEKSGGEKLEEVLEIEAKDVSYRYPLTEKYVLKNVSLKIKKGEKIAFVGENGAGKTTLVKLICGVINPSLGEFKINGIESDQINPQSRYDVLSCMTQEPARYITFTVSDNVFFGDVSKELDGKKINEAIKFAGLDSLNTDTLLGKDIGGTDLSGGQWQKIAIAKNYYRGRSSIILDEPTGNLDPFAETEIFKKYLEFSQDKTVVMVTHRISAAALADRIVVFKDGNIVEDGTHDELIALKGEYSRLYKTQAKWYDR